LTRPRRSAPLARSVAKPHLSRPPTDSITLRGSPSEQVQNRVADDVANRAGFDHPRAVRAREQRKTDRLGFARVTSPCDSDDHRSGRHAERVRSERSISGRGPGPVSEIPWTRGQPPRAAQSFLLEAVSDRPPAEDPVARESMLGEKEKAALLPPVQSTLLFAGRRYAPLSNEPGGSAAKQPAGSCRSAAHWMRGQPSIGNIRFREGLAATANTWAYTCSTSVPSRIGRWSASRHSSEDSVPEHDEVSFVDARPAGSRPGNGHEGQGRAAQRAARSTLLRSRRCRGSARGPFQRGELPRRRRTRAPFQRASGGYD